MENINQLKETMRNLRQKILKIKLIKKINEFRELRKSKEFKKLEEQLSTYYRQKDNIKEISLVYLNFFINHK